MPQEAVDQFAHIVSLFVTFINKREAKKVNQIRSTQASLPIAKSREEILKCLKEVCVSTFYPSFFLTSQITLESSDVARRRHWVCYLH